MPGGDIPWVLKDFIIEVPVGCVCPVWDIPEMEEKVFPKGREVVEAVVEPAGGEPKTDAGGLFSDVLPGWRFSHAAQYSESKPNQKNEDENHHHGA